MFWIQNPDPESESRTQISSPFDVESFDTDYKLIGQQFSRYGKFKEIYVPNSGIRITYPNLESRIQIYNIDIEPT